MLDGTENQGGDPEVLTQTETKETPEPRTYTEDEVKAIQKTHSDEKAVFGRKIAETTGQLEAANTNVAGLTTRLEEIPTLQKRLDDIEDNQAAGDPETLDALKVRREAIKVSRQNAEDKRVLDNNWLAQAGEVQEAKVLKSQIRAMQLAEEHGVDGTELYKLGGGGDTTPASTELMEKLAPSIKPVKPDPVTVADSGATQGGDPEIPATARGKINAGLEELYK